MVKKILLTVLSAAVAAVCVLSAVFRWYIPGYILLAVSLLWFAYCVFDFCRRVSLWGLSAVAALAALVVCGWFPVAFAGYSILTHFEILLIVAAVASCLTVPFYFAKK